MSSAKRQRGPKKFCEAEKFKAPNFVRFLKKKCRKGAELFLDIVFH
jgi:hypothetical protein